MTLLDLKIMEITEVLGEKEINSLDSFVWPDYRSSTFIFQFRNIYGFRSKNWLWKNNETSVILLNLFKLFEHELADIQDLYNK